MENADIARILDEMADILEIQETNVFRVRSYRQAAQTVRGLGEPLRRRAEAGRLQELPNIGKGMAEKILELLDSGRLGEYEDLLETPEAPLVELLKVPGMGPKQAKLVHDELGISSLEELEQAARDERLRALKGMGPKKEANILEGLEQVKRLSGRFRLDQALSHGERILAALRDTGRVGRASMAGSIRRRRETVGDIDVLATCDEEGIDVLMDALTGDPHVETVLARGETKSSVRLSNGIQVDLRIVPDESYGAALHYFTGSKEHNIAVRQRGVRRGLKINEYGVFEVSEQQDERENDEEDSGEEPKEEGERIAGRTEEEVFEAVGLTWVPPELRENQGEIEAAAEDGLPELLELEDIRGDCQMHSTASDGKNSIEEMAEAGRELGYEYIVITDHSKRVTVANGLDEERLLAQWEEIDELDERLDGIRVLKGVEVDILADGTLDLADDCLERADVVVASVHYNRGLGREAMTERIVAALDNPVVDILAHPTGRLLLRREPFEVDIEAVIAAASDHGVLLEINAYPDRLDLNDVHARMARDAGAKLVISTDAHRAAHLDMMRYGVWTARRAWLTADDVANTRGLEDFLKLLRG